MTGVGQVRKFRLVAIVAAALGVCATGVSAAPVRMQAELAEIVRGAAVADYGGYSGTGYISYAAEAGSYVEWVFDVGAAATSTLGFRYANGSGGNRPLKLIVNGVPLPGSFRFVPTASWSTWTTTYISKVALRAGLNTVRAEVVTAAGGPSLDRLDVTSPAQVSPTDWAQAMIGSTIGARYPAPAMLGPGSYGAHWRYQSGLFLLGQYRAYQRSGNAAYLNYIKGWVDARTDAASGTILATKTVDPTLKYLDTIMPGRVALLLDTEFGGPSGTPRYRLTADQLWNALKSHKRTPDRIFWHSNSGKNTVLLDGAYMSLPFATLYGTRFGQTLPGSPDLFRDVANQLVRDRFHLQDVPGTEVDPTDGTGLFYHAYDLEGDALSHGLDWSAAGSKHSSVIWCRAMGWYAMTLVDILELFPSDAAHQGDRGTLVAILQSLMQGLKARQGSDGRWPTVVYFPDGPVPGNFLDTSCSAMFVYAMSKAMAAGDLDASYAKVASRAYQGVLGQLTLQPETIGGATRYLTSLAGIAAGQEVQATPDLYTTSTFNDQNVVVPRKNPLTNDLHGLGAFLLMYEQVKRSPKTISPF